MAAALSLQPREDTPDELAGKLERRLEGCVVSVIDGSVLVEHHRLGQQALTELVELALRKIYGPGWRDRLLG